MIQVHFDPFNIIFANLLIDYGTQRTWFSFKAKVGELLARTGFTLENVAI